jgi:hypothetical protein
MTSTLDISASRIAATWLSARASPIRCSTHGNALPGSIQDQGSLPFARRISRSAMAAGVPAPQPNENTSVPDPVWACEGRMPPHGHHYHFVFEHNHDHDGDRD